MRNVNFCREADGEGDKVRPRLGRMENENRTTLETVWVRMTVFFLLCFNRKRVRETYVTRVYRTTLCTLGL